MVRPAKTELLLRTFKWPERMRERDSDADWFAVEYLAYLDEHGKRRSFTVGKEDGGDIPQPMLSEHMFTPFDIQDLRLRTFAIRLMLCVSTKTGDAFATSG